MSWDDFTLDPSQINRAKYLTHIITEFLIESLSFLRFKGRYYIEEQAVFPKGQHYWYGNCFVPVFDNKS